MPEVKRINVAVNTDEVTALTLQIDREGVSLTEAFRRLVGYGDFVYRNIRDEGATIRVVDGPVTRKVELL